MTYLADINLELLAKLTEVLLIFIPFALIIAVLLWYVYRSNQKEQQPKANLDLYLAQYRSKSGVLCNSYENFDRTHMQFFGTVLAHEISVGSKLQFEDYEPWEITALYPDRNDPDRKVATAPSLASDLAIVVRKTDQAAMRALESTIKQVKPIYLAVLDKKNG